MGDYNEPQPYLADRARVGRTVLIRKGGERIGYAHFKPVRAGSYCRFINRSGDRGSFLGGCFP